MARRSDSPLGTPCWVDLLTSDRGCSQEFYRRLFGWTVEDPDAEYGGYQNFRLHDVRVAGCMRNDGDAPYGRLATVADPTGAVFRLHQRLREVDQTPR